jgi:hypothetical protein
MSRERFNEAVVEELERDLRDALAIEPSPDFARQVRARINARPGRAVRWRVALPIAAMCVLAIGLGVWMNRDQGSRVPACQGATVPGCLPAEARSAKVDHDVHLPARAMDAAGHPSGSPVATHHTNVGSIPQPTSEPEIIVPPDRARALARFLELARRGTVNEQSLRPVASAAPPPVLDIAPLVVPLISVPDIEPQNGAAESGADRE